MNIHMPGELIELPGSLLPGHVYRFSILVTNTHIQVSYIVLSAGREYRITKSHKL